MPIANISSDWVGGDLVFKDASGNTVATVSASGIASAIAGNVTGDVTGNVTGNISGNVVPRVSYTAAANITAGQLLYISGWDATGGRYSMNLADADATNPAKCALFVAESTVAQGALGYAVGEATLSAQNTNSASAVGDPVYVGTTAGGWSLTAPTAAGAAIQQVGVVSVKSATVGVVKLFPFYSKAISVNTIE